MTTHEAIKMAEYIVRSSRRDLKEKKYVTTEANDRRNLDLMETLLDAARMGVEVEEHRSIMDELTEDEWLVPWAVRGAIRNLREVIAELEKGRFYVCADGERSGFVIEPVLHTALAALEKCRNEWGEEVKEEVDESGVDIEGDVDALPEKVREAIEEISRKLGAKVIVEKRTITAEKLDKEKSTEQL